MYPRRSTDLRPGRGLLTSLIRTAVLATGLLFLSAVQVLPQVPDPPSHFGFQPGDDRQLANWDELGTYYGRVAAASDRVSIDTIGASTGGLPMVMLTVTSPANHARLEEIRATQMRLADPRTIHTPAELDSLRAIARTIVLLTAHIHSTEVGAGQMPANLLYRLATSTDSATARILDEVVLIVIPSLNPDGTQLISDWYRRYAGTPYEGIPPVELYHRYVGHDNNRDWYALTQKETQLVVQAAHNAWRPMIVHDVHQMGQAGARMFVPPYVEPYDPNIDPLLISAINRAGNHIAAELRAEGKTGVVTDSQYDLFTPARAFMHYHGGVRILSETASANLATPIFLRGTDLGSMGTFDARRASPNFPVPWEGGVWGLPQIVSYQESAAVALLTHAAENREFWIDTFYEVNRRAVEKWPEWPDYWVLQAGSTGEKGLASVLRILTAGGVEVRRTQAGFRAGRIAFPEGSYVISMRQPYASWVQTLLEVQDYPYDASADWNAPYDVTAHTLPLLMGVRAIQLAGDLVVPLSDPIAPVDASYVAPDFLTGAAPRIGVYRGWRESIPAGWTRWLLDVHGVAYTSLSDEDFRRGGLENRFDVILFQDQPAYQIVDGWDRRDMPAEYAGGIGYEGLAALRRFVERGGRLVAIESATKLAIEAFGLRIQEVQTPGRSAFYIPGAILSLDVATERRDVWGDGGGIAWFSRSSLAFASDDRRVEVIARYGSGNPRLSGLVLGGSAIADRPAILQTRVGRGSVVLFGFQPNYRGQSLASWSLLFRALAGEAGS